MCQPMSCTNGTRLAVEEHRTCGVPAKRSVSGNVVGAKRSRYKFYCHGLVGGDFDAFRDGFSCKFEENTRKQEIRVVGK